MTTTKLTWAAALKAAEAHALATGSVSATIMYDDPDYHVSATWFRSTGLENETDAHLLWLFQADAVDLSSDWSETDQNQLLQELHTRGLLPAESVGEPTYDPRY